MPVCSRLVHCRYFFMFLGHIAENREYNKTSGIISPLHFVVASRCVSILYATMGHSCLFEVRFTWKGCGWMEPKERNRSYAEDLSPLRIGSDVRLFYQFQPASDKTRFRSAKEGGLKNRGTPLLSLYEQCFFLQTFTGLRNIPEQQPMHGCCFMVDQRY